MSDDPHRVILITGANGGLGQAIAAAFLAESPRNKIWLGVHSNRTKAEEFVAKNAEQARLIDLDVTKPESWENAVRTIVARDGGLEVLVNNAGSHADHLLATMPREAWHRTLETNLDGVFHGCQAVLKQMIAQRRGRIVNISSLSALLAPAGQANYAAAKAGMLALSQSLAKEVARIGITVNSICPGYIETEALAGLSEEARKGALQKIPMRRFGRAEEVAAAVLFLACAQSAYITGSTLKIDGGIY